MAYMQDYDGSWIPNCPWRADNSPGWMSMAAWNCPQARIYPYVKNLQIFACPSLKGWKLGGATPMMGAWAYPAEWAGYTFVYAPNRLGDPGAPAREIENDPTVSPADIPAWGDAAYANSFGSQHCVAYPKIVAPNGCGYAAILAGTPGDYTAHNGGSNLCYFDGHAKWQQAQKIMATPF